MRAFLAVVVAAAARCCCLAEDANGTQPHLIVWTEERLNRYWRGSRFGGRKHERVGSVVGNAAMRNYLGLPRRTRCDALLRVGKSSDGGRQVCLRGVDQSVADDLSCTWHFDPRFCEARYRRLEPDARRVAADRLRRLLVPSGGGDDCLVYSFGVRDNWDFDVAAASLGCEVHSFDPTVVPEVVPAGVHFHRVGLGANDGDRIKLSESADAAATRIASLRTIQCDLGHGHRALTLLKIDIEGQEWDVLAAIHAPPPAAQLLVELHFWGAACLRKAAAWFRDQAHCSPTVNRGTPCTTWRRVCLGAPPSRAELARWAATLRGLRDSRLAVARVEANAYSNVLLNVSAPGVDSLVDFDTLCCYESAIVATAPPEPPRGGCTPAATKLVEAEG